MEQLTILPPAWIGIVGGGQLGMYLAQIARQFGYKVAILDPLTTCPASKYADLHLVNEYSDSEALSRLAKRCSVVTTEFENIPALSLETMAKFSQVYPDAQAVSIAQHRIKEKEFCQAHNLACVDFLAINTLEDCAGVSAKFFPAILKTATLGYDGKGQRSVNNHQQLVAAYQELSHTNYILEKKVALALEVSVIVARNKYGIINFPVIENQHHHGILAISYLPARISDELAAMAISQARKLIEALDYTGLLCVEFFITHDGLLLINEIAPRTHNSGHITLDAVISSQFEQQLRAICGLPFASTKLKQAGVMFNLLGDLWLQPNSPWLDLLTQAKLSKLYYYGKDSAKVGRKMGHLSLVAATLAELDEEITQLSAWIAKN